jgi:integrase
MCNAPGRRPGEAFALRWRDLDLKVGAVTVQRAVMGKGKARTFGPPKNPQSRRRVPLDDALR